MPVLSLADTAQVRAGDRLDYWMHHSEFLGGVDVDTFDGEHLTARLTATHLGTVQVCRIAVGRHRIERTRKRIEQNDRELLKVVFQNRGEACIEQHTRRVILRPGEWMIYDTSRPYKLFTTVPNEQLALVMPRTEVAALGVRTSLITMQPFRTARGVSQLLHRCLTSTLDDLDEDSHAYDGDVGASVLEIFKAALNERIAQNTGDSALESMSQRIRTYIRRNYSNPDLSVEEIAAAMKCTKRYLYKVFREDETISEYIWSLRLERSASDLVRPELLGRSITEIAFANGFSNSAHFSRKFKERNGLTPREYRARGLGRVRH